MGGGCCCFVLFWFVFALFFSLGKQKSYTSMEWNLWPFLPSTAAATWLERYIWYPSRKWTNVTKKGTNFKRKSHLPTNDFFLGICSFSWGGCFQSYWTKKKSLTTALRREIPTVLVWQFHPSGWTMHPFQLNQKGIFSNHGAVKDNPFRMVKDRWILLQRSRMFFLITE